MSYRSTESPLDYDDLKRRVDARVRLTRMSPVELWIRYQMARRLSPWTLVAVLLAAAYWIGWAMGYAAGVWG